MAFGTIVDTLRNGGEPPGSEADSIAELIERCNAGDGRAKDLLIERFYRDLRRIAAGQLRAERRNHTLQPTALVHEVYARFIQQSEWQVKNRLHFIAIASQLMRQVLVDHARKRLAGKRGGEQRQVTLDEALFAQTSNSLDVLALDEVLTRLAKLNARHGRIVELHFFGGLTFDEIGEVLGVAGRTVKRDWRMARAWLRNELSRGQLTSGA